MLISPKTVAAYPGAEDGVSPPTPRQSVIVMMADKPQPLQSGPASTEFDKSQIHMNNSSLSSSDSFSFSSFFHQSPQYTSTSNMTTSPQHNQTVLAASSMQSSRISVSPPRDSKKLDIHSLMSPPDQIHDSFRAGAVGKSNDTGSEAGLSKKLPLPMSPPVSPFSKPVSTTRISPASPSPSLKDPVLYPSDENSPASPPQPPLFAVAEYEDHRRIVDEHLRARSASIFSGVAPPRREEYELALFFRSQVMRHYTANPRAWLKKERALLQADRKAGAQRYHSIMPAKPIVAKPPRSHRIDRVSKPQAAPRAIRTSNGATPVSPMRPTGRVSATPEPSRRIVAPNREDKDFASLPDYCPPLSSLPSRSNSLKVDWKGQPIDLSTDPQAHLLHPDEVTLAGNLRLDCATYLTSKRRIFERRLQCLRTGKEFRKTDAQQACKIDVNKASKLWTAFDKVGWLDAEWVRRFL